MYDALLIASALLWLAVTAVYLRSAQACFGHPATFYLAFHGLVFAIRPLVAAWYDFDFIYRLYAFTPSPADKVTAVLAANLAMVVFVGTTCWLCRRDRAPPLDDHQAARARLLRPILVVCALLGPLAIGSQLSNWSLRAGGFDSMVRDAATGALINTTQIGWFTDFGLMLAPLAVLLVWAARYRWWGWMCFATFAVLQAGTGTRGPLVYACVALTVLYLSEARRRWPEWRAALALGLLGIAFSQLLIDRGEGLRSGIGRGDGQQHVPQSHHLLDGMDFAGLEYLEFVIYAVPQRTGTYDLFASNLQILTEPIPRAFWQDKPVGSPVQFFSLWDYGRPIGMTLSVPGAGWMALGWAGVAIQSLVFALLYGGLYRSLVRRRGAASALLPYALLAATIVVVLRDGALISFVRVLPFYLGPFLVVLGAARVIIGESGSGAGPGAARHSQRTPTPAERRRWIAGTGAP